MNIEELEKLSQLKEKGIITDEEFEKEFDVHMKTYLVVTM